MGWMRGDTVKLLVDYMNGPIRVKKTFDADVIPNVGELLSLDNEKRFLVVKSVVHMFLDNAEQVFLIKAEYEAPAD